MLIGFNSESLHHGNIYNFNKKVRQIINLEHIPKTYHTRFSHAKFTKFAGYGIIIWVSYQQVTEIGQIKKMLFINEINKQL